MILFLLIALLTLCASFVAAHAETEDTHTCGDFRYTIQPDDTATLTEYTGRAETLSIPPELDGHAVTIIGRYAFRHCKSLVSLSIPEGVTGIDDFAFHDCTFLASLSLPDSLKSIGINPFTYCNDLTEFVLSPNHPFLEVVDNMLINKVEKKLIGCPYLLSGCTSLLSVRRFPAAALFRAPTLSSASP